MSALRQMTFFAKVSEDHVFRATNSIVLSSCRTASEYFIFDLKRVVFEISSR